MNILKKVIIAFVFGIILFIPSVKAEEVTLYLFHGDGCPHCADEIEYLKEVEADYPNLNIVKYEVWYNDENQVLLTNVKETFGINNSYVPFTVIGTKTLIGFNEDTKDSIIKYLDEAYDGDYQDVVSKVIEAKTSITIEKDTNNNTVDTDNVSKDYIKTLPILGKVNVKSFSLPAIATALGLVDGFNPCAMWILIFLISMLIGTKDRKRMLILGSIFLITSSLVYMGFMMAWLTVTIKMSKIIWIRTIIALVALIGAFINIRTYIKTKETGCNVVDDKKRKNIIEKIKKFTTQKSFILSIIGIMALAISVNFIELACSAGLPLLFTQILALNDLSSFQYFMYILLYIFFYLFDDLVIFIIAMVTFRVTGISNKYTKYSHLIGGILMLIIGLLLIFKPEWIMLNF